MKWPRLRRFQTGNIKKDQELFRQHDGLSFKCSFIDVSFHVEHYPWIQVWCVPRSISQRHAGGHGQTENKGTSPDCKAFSLSPSLPPPPPPLSTCLCAGLLLISEALSFVSVRCPKDCGMKRDTWRGAWWLWLRCVTTHAHTHTKTVTAESHRQSLPVNPLHPPFFPLETRFPLPTAASLETWVKSSRRTWWQEWNLIETAPNWWRVREATDQLSVAWFKIDEALNCLSLSPGWVCVLGLIRPLSWRGRKPLPISNKVNPYLS